MSVCSCQLGVKTYFGAKISVFLRLSKKRPMHIMFGGNSPKVILKSCKMFPIVFLFLKNTKKHGHGNSEIHIAFYTYQEILASHSSIQMITFHIFPFYQPIFRINLRARYSRLFQTFICDFEIHFHFGNFTHYNPQYSKSAYINKPKQPKPIRNNFPNNGKNEKRNHRAAKQSNKTHPSLSILHYSVTFLSRNGFFVIGLFDFFAHR